MTLTNAEAVPVEDVVATVPPTLVEASPAAPATEHVGGSVYTCPACRQLEDKEG